MTVCYNEKKLCNLKLCHLEYLWHFYWWFRWWIWWRMRRWQWRGWLCWCRGCLSGTQRHPFNWLPVFQYNLIRSGWRFTDWPGMAYPERGFFKLFFQSFKEWGFKANVPRSQVNLFIETLVYPPPTPQIHNNLLPDVDFNIIYLAMYINFMLIVYKTDLMIGLLKLTQLHS